MINSWTLDGSDKSGPISARSEPLVHLPEIQGAGSMPAHAGLFDRSDLASHILVLLASLILMLLMLSCLPEI